MKAVVSIFVVTCLLVCIMTGAYAGADPELGISFSLSAFYDKIQDVIADYDPFPVFPSYPSLDDNDDATFFDSVGNFFRYVVSVFSWGGSFVVWIVNDIILGFRFVACFIPITLTQDQIEAGPVHGGGSGWRGGR